MNFGAFQKATDLHKRIWFTVIALVVYRIGVFMPIPGIDPAKYAEQFGKLGQGIIGMLNMFNGGAIKQGSILSLGVMPYISASIIVQLLQSVYPPWEKLKKEGGEAGRKQLNQYTRYLTVALAIFQAAGTSATLLNPLAYQPGIYFTITAIVTLTGGTMFLMWLGEQITSRGVGNGVSLIIFAGIVARFPDLFGQLFTQARENAIPIGMLFMVIAILIGVVFAIVFIERSQRRILIQYPKQQRGNRMIGGDTSFLPIKINSAGVIPPIFASSLLVLPATIIGFASTADLPPWLDFLQNAAGSLSPGRPLHMGLYAFLIIFFCFFYTSVVFNPEDTAENLRKYGGFVPGIRPGKRTAEYLSSILTRLTVIGAAYITAVCLLPEFAMAFNPALSAMAYGIGGTSILIVVSVTMDTVAQIQSHLLQHQYEGLIRKSKLRGRNK